MTLYWPEARVALRIVDDPSGSDFDANAHKDWEVLEVTTAQLEDLEGSRAIGDRLCTLLGVEPPEKTPEWLAANERLHRELMANPGQFIPI